MELKFLCQWVNPNETFSFNRTFMELKLFNNSSIDRNNKF